MPCLALVLEEKKGWEPVLALQGIHSVYQSCVVEGQVPTPLSFPRTMQSKVYLNMIFSVGASLTIVDQEGSGLERDPLRPQSHGEAN